MNAAVRQTDSEIVAFGDANATWAPDALRKLVRSFADPDVAYVCGQVRFQREDGTNKEGLYWRYEMWLRASESALGSITGGNGAIYAVRRDDYVEWPFGHDLGFPALMVQRGRRAVYDPEALAFEKPSKDNEDEFRRKVRMLPLVVAAPLRGGKPQGPAAALPRGAPLAPRPALRERLPARRAARDEHRPRRRRLALPGRSRRSGRLARARRGRPPAAADSGSRASRYYYLLMSSATVAALGRYLREGAPADVGESRRGPASPSGPRGSSPWRPKGRR